MTRVWFTTLLLAGPTPGAGLGPGLLGATGLALLRRPGVPADQQGHRGVAEHLLRDASRDGAAQARAAVGRHGDEVDVVEADRLQDLLRGIALLHQAQGFHALLLDT